MAISHISTVLAVLAKSVWTRLQVLHKRRAEATMQDIPSTPTCNGVYSGCSVLRSILRRSENAFFTCM